MIASRTFCALADYRFEVLVVIEYKYEAFGGPQRNNRRYSYTCRTPKVPLPNLGIGLPRDPSKLRPTDDIPRRLSGLRFSPILEIKESQRRLARILI